MAKPLDDNLERVMTEKRYQVFVSSTFRDLQEERQHVIQALLELDCIPSGMELFPAADEDQWSLIQEVIDDCDYYVLIMAGRYGSLGPGGQSYTEMEYRYALEKKKPVIAFLYKDPGKLLADRCETTEEGKRKLEEFRSFVQQKMCRFWESPVDLGGKVSRSLVQLIKRNPGVGWVRGNLVPDAGTAQEILRLKKTIEDLNARLAAARSEAPAGTAAFAQGDDEVTLRYSFDARAPEQYASKRFSFVLVTSWNAIFGFVSPKLLDELPERLIRAAVCDFIASEAKKELTQQKEFKGRVLSDFRVVDVDFQTIKVQLRALGLIARSEKTRSVKDTDTYWTLTPFGDTVMTRLRAVPRANPSESATSAQNDVASQVAAPDGAAS